MTDPATAAWIAVAAGIVFTIAVIVLSCVVVARDLPAPEPEPLWLDGDEWVEPA